MKSIKLLLLLFLPFMSLKGQETQKNIDGFFGIKFGTPKAQAMSSMKAKGAILDPKLSTATIAGYSSLTFAKRRSSLAAIYFVNDKLYQGTVFLEASNENEVVDLFDEIVAELGELYPNQEVYKHFKTPYEEGDGHEVTAIKLGYATYSAFWNTPVTNGKPNYISLSITTDMDIKLTYQHGSMMETVTNKSKQEKAKDY